MVNMPRWQFAAEALPELRLGYPVVLPDGQRITLRSRTSGDVRIMEIAGPGSATMHIGIHQGAAVEDVAGGYMDLLDSLFTRTDNTLELRPHVGQRLDTLGGDATFYQLTSAARAPGELRLLQITRVTI